MSPDAALYGANALRRIALAITLPPENGVRRVLFSDT